MTKEILNAGNVQTVPFSGDTLCYVVCLEQLVILARCVLVPLITVKEGTGHISFFVGSPNCIEHPFQVISFSNSVGDNLVVIHVINDRQE